MFEKFIQSIKKKNDYVLIAWEDTYCFILQQITRLINYISRNNIRESLAKQLVLIEQCNCLV